MDIITNLETPLWQTWWTYTLYLLFFIASVLILRRFIVSREKLKALLVFEKHEHEKTKQICDQKEELKKMKLRFFTNASHEIITPLSLIISPLDYIIKQTSGSEIEDSVKLIQQNAHLLLRLTNQLIDMSKIETGFMKPSVSEGDIVSFIAKVVSGFNFRAESLNIDYYFHSSAENATAWYDEDILEKILYNLLSNAFKFTPEGGKIEIDLKIKLIKNDGDQTQDIVSEIELLVSDSGPEISESKRTNVFEDFYQSSNSVSFQCSDIGQTLVYQLVKILKGNISSQGSPEGGSCFVLHLPVEKSKFSPDEIKEKTKILSYTIIEETEQYRSSEDHFKKKKILKPLHIRKDLPSLLIVDDNEEVRRFLIDNLEEKYNIREAENGLVASVLALELMPDLIISDVMMPICDGFEFCRNIKADEKTSHIPVILLTAKSGTENKIEGTETGADDYIEKPFDLSYLRSKIENLLQSRQKLREAFSKKFNINPADVTSNSRDSIFLEKLMALVERNIDNPDFSVDDIVPDIGMSRSQLYRKLKSITDQSVNDFIQNHRLNQAGKFLLETDYSVAEICYRVGFKDPSYFTKCFRKKFKCVPTEFPKKYAST